jgi:hypothetical protein
MALVPRAVAIVADLMEDADSEPVRLKAALEVIDRGYGKAVDVAVELTPADLDGAPSPLVAAFARVLRDRGLARAEDLDVVDAVVVEGDSEDPPST